MDVWIAIADPETETAMIAGVYTTEDAARDAAERAADGGRWSTEPVVLDEIPEWLIGYEQEREDQVCEQHEPTESLGRQD